MINFDELPNSKPVGFSTLEKGRYKGKIEKAEMKQGKDPKKPPYLSLQWALSKDGKPKGKFFDILTEPGDAEIPRYKLKRFIMAFNLPITGNFTLNDIAKMVVNKEAYLDIAVDTKSEPARNQVDVFSGEIYYRIDEVETKQNVEIAASDASDVADDLPWENDGAEADY